MGLREETSSFERESVIEEIVSAFERSPFCEGAPEAVTELRHLEEISNQYGEPAIKRDQQRIIDQLQNLTEQFAEHARSSATRSDIESHDESVKASVQAESREVKETIRLLHGELRKSSLRHRLTIYAGTAVVLATGLSLSDLLVGPIIIARPTPTIILVGAVLFFLMARAVPAPRDLSQDHKHG